MMRTTYQCVIDRQEEQIIDYFTAPVRSDNQYPMEPVDIQDFDYHIDDNYFSEKDILFLAHCYEKSIASGAYNFICGARFFDHIDYVTRFQLLVCFYQLSDTTLFNQFISTLRRGGFTEQEYHQHRDIFREYERRQNAPLCHIISPLHIIHQPKSVYRWILDVTWENLHEFKRALLGKEKTILTAISYIEHRAFSLLVGDVSPENDKERLFMSLADVDLRLARACWDNEQSIVPTTEADLWIM